MIDPYEAAEIIGWPVPTWEGNCFAVASQFVEHGIVAGTPVYGFWIGPIHPLSVFAKRPFTHHGWVELPSGKVVDPTRWVFECVPPYVYAGPADYYRETADVLDEFHGREKPPAFDPADKVSKLAADDQTMAAVRDILGNAPDQPVTYRQAFWLANLSPRKLGPHAPRIYDALRASGHGALIPLDNEAYVTRKMR